MIRSIEPGGPVLCATLASSPAINQSVAPLQRRSRVRVDRIARHWDSNVSQDDQHDWPCPVHAGMVSNQQEKSPWTWTRFCPEDEPYPDVIRTLGREDSFR